MDKPTIGRIVIYHPAKDRSDGVLHNGGAADVPAMIVAVWGDTCVNLKVITDAPHDAWVTSASMGTGERNWSWPVRTDSTVPTGNTAQLEEAGKVA